MPSSQGNPTCRAQWAFVGASQGPASSTSPAPSTERSPLSAQHSIFRHWLALANAAATAFAGLPVAAPALMAAGWHGPALLIYSLYQSVCHQWPGRSYFLFGPRLVYPMDELEPLRLGMARDFVGNAAMGFKVAYCERDFAIYTTVLLAGLAYALMRARARPLPWAVFFVCLAPLALDGFTQLFGLHESTWTLRTLTGALAGFAGVWLLYPRVDEAVRPGGRRQPTAWSRPPTASSSSPTVGPGRAASEAEPAAPRAVADG